MQELTLDEAQDLLMINRNELDQAIIKQPQYYYQVSKQVVEFQERKDREKNELDKIEYGISSECRETLVKGKVKFTEATLKEQVQNDEEFREARQTYLDARRDFEEWVAIKDAFNQRGFMLRELARLWTSNYYADPTVSAGSNVSESVRRHNRKAISETRTGKRRRGNRDVGNTV